MTLKVLFTQNILYIPELNRKQHKQPNTMKEL